MTGEKKMDTFNYKVASYKAAQENYIDWILDNYDIVTRCNRPPLGCKDYVDRMDEYINRLIAGAVNK